VDSSFTYMKRSSNNHGILPITITKMTSTSSGKRGSNREVVSSSLLKSKVGCSWREGCRGSIWKQSLYPRVRVRSAYTLLSPDPTKWDYTGLLLLLLLTSTSSYKSFGSYLYFLSHSFKV